MRERIALLLALLALGLAACGDDDEASRESAEPVESAPELSVPGDADSLGETAPEDTTATGTETAPAPEEEAAPPAETTEPPADSPENDTPPPPGSPAERFEEFCEENPGAC